MRESGVRFQTLISRKRLEITLSLWTQTEKVEDALSIELGSIALGQRISEKVGQNLILVLGLRKWSETLVSDI